MAQKKAKIRRIGHHMPTRKALPIAKANPFLRAWSNSYKENPIQVNPRPTKYIVKTNIIVDIIISIYLLILRKDKEARLQATMASPTQIMVTTKQLP
jgi:hypothetical protein